MLTSQGQLHLDARLQCLLTHLDDQPPDFRALRKRVRSIIQANTGSDPTRHLVRSGWRDYYRMHKGIVYAWFPTRNNPGSLTPDAAEALIDLFREMVRFAVDSVGDAFIADLRRACAIYLKRRGLPVQLTPSPKPVGPRQKPLSAEQHLVRDFLLKLKARGKRATGKQIGAMLRKRGHRLSVATVRRHVLPALAIRYGVTNDRDKRGYYIP
jgi:hypothetical protein